MPVVTPPPPFNDAIAETRPRRGDRAIPSFVASRWIEFFTDQSVRIGNSPERVALVQKTDQSASIASTALPIASVITGVYRLTYYVTVTTAATTNSSIEVDFAWTDGGQSKTFSGTAFTGNTTGTVGSQSVLIEADRATPITYSTTYSSTGATAMKYDLTIVTESIA